MMAVEIYKPSPDSHLVQADSTDDQSKQAEGEGLKPTIDLKENQLHLSDGTEKAIASPKREIVVCIHEGLL